VGDRFERHYPIGLVFLALIEALHARVVTEREFDVRDVKKEPAYPKCSGSTTVKRSFSGERREFQKPSFVRHLSDTVQ
jgi:hypothetical protein